MPCDTVKLVKSILPVFQGQATLDAEKAFGQVLRDLRRGKGLSQESLAFEAELDRNYVSLLELGRNSASLKTIFKLAHTLDVSVAVLMALVEARMSHHE